MLITIFILGFVLFVILCIKAGDINHNNKKQPITKSLNEHNQVKSINKPNTVKNTAIDPAMLRRPWDIMMDSISILNTTTNIETALSRYAVILNNIIYIKTYYTEQQIISIGFKSKADLLEDEDIFSNEDRKAKVINNVIGRAYKQKIKAIKKLKRDSSKITSINKFFDKIKITEGLPEQCKIFCDNLLSEFKKEFSLPSDQINNTTLVKKRLNDMDSSRLLNTQVENVLKVIPKEIINLLWFIDGPLKNTNHTGATKKTCSINNYMSFTVFYNTGEPSLISERYPIGKVITPAPKLDYYPTYRELTPDQRATYLNWLKDIDQPINIGYVFIFFYGLERYLYLTSKFEEAFYMVLRLRKFHKDNYSFNGYSIDSLVGSALVHRRLDLIKFLISLAPEEHTLTDLELACMATFGISMTAKQVVSQANCAGFYNKRYIKLHNELFINTLEHTLQEKYEDKSFPMHNSYLDDTEKYAPIRLSANISLTQCETPLYRVNTNKNFKANIFEVLQETHNKVKEILKQQRKKK